MATPKINKPVVKAKPEQHTRTHNANPKLTLTTPTGRSLVYQQVGPLERFHIMGILGGDLCRNPATLNQALMICGIREIDGDPVMLPSTFELLENLILKVSDDGFAALILADANGTPGGGSAGDLTDEELDRAGE